MDLLPGLRFLRLQPALRRPVLVLLLRPGGLLPLRNAVQHGLADGSSELKPFMGNRYADKLLPDLCPRCRLDGPDADCGSRRDRSGGDFGWSTALNRRPPSADRAARVSIQPGQGCSDLPA